MEGHLDADFGSRKGSGREKAKCVFLFIEVSTVRESWQDISLRSTLSDFRQNSGKFQIQ